jgi:DMSO/TMAO reductase YedYZ molybdopterin-dependent catalytic subunit
MNDRRPGLPSSGSRIYSRRTLLEWFGSASALSLAGMSLGCQADEDPLLAALNARGRADVAGADAGDRNRPSPAGAGIIFAATADAMTTISPWGENTVDPQDEASLLDSWTLTVDGLVETPVELTFAELLALKRQDQVTDFHCVEGWSVWDVPWNGVHISTLLERVKPLSGATHVTFHCVEAANGKKYDESLPLDVGLEAKTLLAYGADDLALPLRHGFPLRCVIPRLHGYKGAKTIERVELTDKPISGFWVQRGYPYDAPVEPERLREGKY